jgi:hypothetical protein
MSEPANIPNPGDLKSSAPIKPVKFVHNRNSNLPTYQADGAWGGANQYGMIRVSFYTESPPIPTAVIQPVHPDGRPNGDPSVEGLDDPKHFIVVRDFQCDVILTVSSAAQIAQMLANIVAAVQQQMKDQAQAVQQPEFAKPKSPQTK